jgi:alpha-aminoadipic semialdehyde synthase
MNTIGIRREDKNEWERRAPLIPEDVKQLHRAHAIQTVVQPSQIRVFPDDEYTGAGTVVQNDLSPSSVIFAIKEIPLSFFESGKTYVFFSHTIKGQPTNMPMLRRVLELKCQLIDYERIVDDKGNRLIAFGRYAGIAGMIDALWALGRRLDWEGISNPFSGVKHTTHYASLEEAKEGIQRAGRTIGKRGLPKSLTPLVCGITGYGNVSRGAQEVLGWLPVREIRPAELSSLCTSPISTGNQVVKVIFKEEDIVQPIRKGDRFELLDYYRRPENYRSRFSTYMPYLTLLINGIYWDERYPRLVTKAYLKRLYDEGSPHLRVICDVSCDVGGSIESTVRHTNPGNPVFVYEPMEEKAIDGWKGIGPVVLAVDNLPCELARESSIYFSRILRDYVPQIANADFSKSFLQCGLTPPIRGGVIVYHGELTPTYRYIRKHLDQHA